jgi:hypothetical protein
VEGILEQEEVSGIQMKVHIEKLLGLLPLPVISVIKSRGVSWAGHVAYMGEKKRVLGSGEET